MKAECLKLSKMRKFRELKLEQMYLSLDYDEIFLVINKLFNKQMGIIPFIWR